jgi:hypothetical protein
VENDAGCGSAALESPRRNNAQVVQAQSDTHSRATRRWPRPVAQRWSRNARSSCAIARLSGGRTCRPTRNPQLPKECLTFPKSIYPSPERNVKRDGTPSTRCAMNNQP